MLATKLLHYANVEMHRWRISVEREQFKEALERLHKEGYIYGHSIYYTTRERETGITVRHRLEFWSKTPLSAEDVTTIRYTFQQPIQYRLSLWTYNPETKSFKFIVGFE